MEDVASNLESLVSKYCVLHCEFNLVCVVSVILGDILQYFINVHMFVGSLFFSWKEKNKT